MDLENTKDFEFNHDGNASRLIDLFGHLLRYDSATKTWIIWKGKRWVTEKDKEAMVLEIMPYARDLANRILPNLSVMCAASNPTKSEALAKWAQASQNQLFPTVNHLKARALELRTSISEWDSDEHRHLLIADNGVVDLRTGELHVLDHTYKMTKRVYLPYEPAAQCPRWIQFLHEIFDGDAEMVAYMQRLIGYCLTGEVKEKKLFFLYGPKANNGKSTFTDILTLILGDAYIKKIPVKAFMRYKDANPNAPNENIASLRGVRVSISDESEHQDRLNGPMIKELTGVTDRITARHNYGSNFSFVPTHKIFIICNQLPTIEGGDQAIWNRVQCIPFDVVFVDKDTNPEREGPPADKEIYGKLRAELTGILAWCIEGAQQYYRDGLQPPAKVLRTSADYQEDEDTLGMFIEEGCVLGESYHESCSGMYHAYVYWCEGRKEFPLPQRAFTQAMKRKGFKDRTPTQRGWQGIKTKEMSAFTRGM